MNIEAAFRTFLSNIEPSSSHVDQAKTGHETLRARLESDGEFKAKLEGGTFLCGSYRRQTAVKPVKDVDIIVPLKPSDVTPRECLEELRDVLKKYYKAPALENQRRSIKVELSYITMDIVPAVARNGADGMLEVPDREQHEWVKSHPKEHLAYTQGLNKSSDGAYVPLVKALKWWRKFRLLEFPGFSGHLGAAPCGPPRTARGSRLPDGCGGGYDCRTSRCSRLRRPSRSHGSCRSAS